MQAAIISGVAKVGGMLSADSPAVLNLVRSSPAEAAPIMFHFMKGILTQTGGVPAPPLVDAALEHYARSQDVQFLALLVPGMPAKQALENIEQLVRMPREAFVEAIRNIIRRSDGSDGVVNARELLIRLHLLDPQVVKVRCTTASLLVPCRKENHVAVL
jgi:hypothetical protein